MLDGNLIFIVVCLATVLITVAFIIAVKGIYFYGRRTDNHAIINTAACVEKWGTLSGMHKFAGGKAHMKEFAVVALALMQRVLKDRHSDYALVVLCAVANAVSAVFVYLICAYYWGIKIGFLIFLFYIFSFWPFLIALWGGVVAVAQAVALGAIHCLQLAEIGVGIDRLAWYGAAGIMTALVFFSSASSRKYLPLIAAAFFGSLCGEFYRYEEGTINPLIIAVLAGTLVAGGLLFKFSSHWIMSMIYARKAPGFLNRLINNRNRSLDEYTGIMDKITMAVMKAVALVAVYLLGIVLLTHSVLFWSAHAAVLIGFGLTVFVFIYPNVKQSLWGYFLYSQYGKPLWRSRFYTYKDFFTSIGHPISDDMRGAGWSWVLRYFHIMIKIPLYLYALCIGLLVFSQVMEFRFDQAIAGLIMIILSLSPVLMAEWSKAVQVGRSYFPAFIGILFLIGFTFYTALPVLGESVQKGLWAVAWLLGTVNLAVNLVIFLTDVLPSRLSVNRLVNLLRRNGIKKFYTYDIEYNEVFIQCIPRQIQEEFDIHFIKSLAEVKQGHVVVPPTNTKGAMLSDFPLAQRRTNTFDQDPYLNTMIESKEIENKTLAWLSSMGSSRIWLHEAEVPSFRHLILKETTPMDFYRGRAWVLNI